MRPRSSIVLVTAALATFGVAGCGKITLAKLHEKNRAAIDAADGGLQAMAGLVASAPRPTVGAACAKPGWTLAPSFADGDPGASAAVAGELVEVVDAADLGKAPAGASTPRFARTDGPVAAIASEKRNSEESPDLRVDEKGAQLVYDVATRVRHVIVVRPPAGEGSRETDVFVFAYPKVSLECSFAIDEGADRTFAAKNGYDPKTGEPVAATATAVDESPLALVAGQLKKRFGLTLPRPGAPEGAATIDDDDARVTKRASAIAHALASPPKHLATCDAPTVAGALRVNRARLQVIAGHDLLDGSSANRTVDPNVSADVKKYLLTRDPGAAEKLASAASWAVVDIETGGPATIVGSDSFVGGAAAGRVVVFDRDGKPQCAKPFRIDAPATFDARVLTVGGFTTSTVGEISREYLREHIDAAFGPPP